MTLPRIIGCDVKGAFDRIDSRETSRIHGETTTRNRYLIG